MFDPIPFRALAASLIAAVALLGAGCATRPSEPVAVKILAINDFHGNLKPAPGGIRIQDPSDRSKSIVVQAGGAEALATAVQRLRAQNPNHIFVAAGDLIGATPLLSALFNDEPTIESLSAMGLETSAVGNHEFDRGAAELLRLQNGGCAPEGCKGPQPFKGAQFKYLAASTIDEKSGKPLFPAYHVKRFQGIPVAFIGLTLKDTPTIVVPSGVAGLTFRDEAETVNALVPELRRQGIEAIVLLIHEGGWPSGDYNECPGLSGPIVEVVKKLDRAVDVVISGHTHRAYNCTLDGRLVTSAHMAGTVLTQINLVLDPKTGDISSAKADNQLVRVENFAKDARQTELIAAYERLARPLAQRVIGPIATSLSREIDAAGEMPIGMVIADAQLAATREAGAQIALMNPGGVRAPLVRPDDGLARYESLFTVQPFYNNLVTMTLTGAQLVQVLEQQWLGQPNATGRILLASNGFGYSWDAGKPPGQRIVRESLRLNGQPIAPETPLRVTVNSFLAAGGDNFTVLRQGQQQRTGMMDIDAFEAYVKANPNLGAGLSPRVRRLN